MQRARLIIILMSFASYLSFSAYAKELTNMKKVAMIIAENDFRDEELFQPKEILEQRGIEVKVVSSSLSPAKGMLGAKIKPDMLIGDVNVKDFQAIVFIGGAGASQYWDDPVAHKLAQDAFNSGRIVGAICIAPVTLARAGILKGKRATVWASEAGNIKSEGADYTASQVEKDGNIITASGPSAAGNFGEELAGALKE